MDSRVKVLGSVAEALFPALEEGSKARRHGNSLAQLTVPEPVITKTLDVIQTRLAPADRQGLLLVLWLLSTRLGSLLLLGRGCLSSRGVPRAFTALPVAQREAALQGWALSSLPPLRRAFKGLKSLLLSVLFTTLDVHGTSAVLDAMGYPPAGPARPPAPAPAALAAESAVAAALVDLASAEGSPAGVAAAAAALAAKGLRVTRPAEAASQLPAAVQAQRPHLAVEADVVVVGSGAGGGVAAARLAEAGLRVIVLEKAGFVPAAEMTLQEGQAFESMYERAGFLTTVDGGMTVLAGSTLGGGTRVNWCASFRTPDHVRREWAEEHGLTDFDPGSGRYSEAMEAVCSRLGVRTGVEHSALCEALRAGVEGVGEACGEVPRNCAAADCSGHCCFGCAQGQKQDSVNTFLADACWQGGMRVLTAAWVDQIVLRPSSGSCGDAAGEDGEAEGGGWAHRRPKQAVGVLAVAGSALCPLRLAVVAPVVVAAAGSIHTPALLLRSGVSCGGNVGANLRLHPCTCVVGLFPREAAATEAAAAGPGTPPREAGGSAATAAAACKRPEAAVTADTAAGVASCGDGDAGSIRPWEGALMSRYSAAAADWEGAGYGALLFTPACHPGLFAAAAPWLGGADFKALAARYCDAAVLLVLTRDRSSAGRVRLGPGGVPELEYRLAPRDAAAMGEGVQLGLRALAAAGADTVMTLLNAPEGRFVFPPGAGKSAGSATASPAAAADEEEAGEAAGGSGRQPSSPAFEAWLGEVRQTGIPHLRMPTFSAHQLGTARLGTDPATSALDPRGECWEVGGLFCCDGSALPTSTGVNPMISIESASYMLAGGIAERAAAGLSKGRRRRQGGGMELAHDPPPGGAA